MTLPITSLRRVEVRLLLEQPDGEARRQAGLAGEVRRRRPAMIRSSDDLPEPLAPITPILAPG